MARLTDGTKTVEIIMRDKKNGVDFSNDFFAIGGLTYDEVVDAYIVHDVEYCILQAYDCKNGEGDFSDCAEPDLDIYIEEL